MSLGASNNSSLASLGGEKREAPVVSWGAGALVRKCVWLGHETYLTSRLPHQHKAAFGVSRNLIAQGPCTVW